MENIEIRINERDNKIEIYWDDIPFGNIPFAKYAGFLSWTLNSSPATRYWIELYSCDRDYQISLDSKETWIQLLKLLNKIPIN